LGERICCLGSLIAVDCEDDSGVLEISLLSTARTDLRFWNSHCCRLRGRICGSGTLVTLFWS